MKVILLGLLISSLVLCSILSEWFRRRADSRMVRSLDQVPTEAVIVVLGCKPRSPSGRLNRYFVGRVASAAAAYHHEPSRQILCSGRVFDDMNEVTELVRGLEAAQVPASAIRRDANSDRTIDSIETVARTFGDKPILFVTQSFHLPRTLFLARRRGLDAWGLLARGGAPGFRGRLRERLAEIRAVFDVLRRPSWKG